MSHPISINEVMVRTAIALCTNTRFFKPKILCTEINDWKQDLDKKSFALKLRCYMAILAQLEASNPYSVGNKFSV